MILKDPKVEEHKLLGKPGLWDSYYMQICKHVYTNTGFPGSSTGKEPARNAGDLGSFSGLERSPGGGHGNPLWYSYLENCHGQRSLVGYSPWGHKELDMTERISIVQHIHTPWTEEPDGLQSIGLQKA